MKEEIQRMLSEIDNRLQKENSDFLEGRRTALVEILMFLQYSELYTAHLDALTKSEQLEQNYQPSPNTGHDMSVA